MTRIQVGAIAVAAVLVTGLVHGFWTERWTTHEEPVAAAARMEHVADVLGSWEGEPIDATPRQTDGIAGHLYRRYVNRQNGQSVTVALFCGRSGPMSIHTPDVCYQGGGYDVGASVKHSLPGDAGAPSAEFRTAPFFKTSSTDRSNLRIFWAWNATGEWTVPDRPRFAFARRPFLYKLYVIREMADSNEPLESDPCLEFMRHLLPELQRCLFPPA
jgi:Protein of unknown function (DUF3485)